MAPGRWVIEAAPFSDEIRIHAILRLSKDHHPPQTTYRTWSQSLLYAAFSSHIAQTLYSGIMAMGSWTGMTGLTHHGLKSPSFRLNKAFMGLLEVFLLQEGRNFLDDIAPDIQLHWQVRILVSLVHPCSDNEIDDVAVHE